MADTKHPPVDLPVEGDGVSYRGVGWFIVILVVTVVFCQVFIWALFRFTEAYRLNRPEIVRAPLSAPAAEPTIQAGQVIRGVEAEPRPTMLVDEPSVLRDYRAREDELLHSYGWVNEGMQIVRLPIDRAKDLLLERGLPTRPDAAPSDSGE